MSPGGPATHPELWPPHGTASPAMVSTTSPVGSLKNRRQVLQAFSAN